MTYDPECTQGCQADDDESNDYFPGPEFIVPFWAGLLIIFLLFALAITAILVICYTDFIA